ncbi:biotin--[acetyl-CoA-carboxylase] ligase [Pedomonas mirosovicensis]|uniref:biotin--[acetyl-CoA-carboxylase] ligase n=1 Tax=Pedomonas mirosovicensis TaxID=2908641 RepID=UPI0021670AFD|nr:biotin--[acetyl-CoA-carboxylase] ligase [Pedomonas mirosovicensis]MCH8685343.1 biotin--[acetyl-CoA-carboxylase] ligase [Pedomonas mirosovicensis]
MAELLHYPAVDSTNDEVIRLAQKGAPDGTWVVADEQTAGRGRRHRPWQSPKGNLFCTGLLRLTTEEEPVSQLSFLIALALYDTLAQWVEPARLKLKWPNDVLLDGKKISGILLESAGSGQPGDRWVAAGIGVNLAVHPDNTERPAISLAAAGIAPPLPMAVAERLATAIDHWRGEWRQGGFAALRSAWLARATGLGSRIEVRLPETTLFGVFSDLAADGALLLQLDSGAVKTIHSGDVFGI